MKRALEGESSSEFFLARELCRWSRTCWHQYSFFVCTGMANHKEAGSRTELPAFPSCMMDIGAALRYASALGEKDEFDFMKTNETYAEV